LELVHENPKEAAKFMEEAFGAVQVEKQWSGWLSDTFNIDCIHMMFGGVVYQILKPSEGLTSHLNVLKTEGPCIHNLSIQVNNAKKFREKLLSMGVKELHNWEKGIVSLPQG